MTYLDKLIQHDNIGFKLCDHSQVVPDQHNIKEGLNTLLNPLYGTVMLLSQHKKYEQKLPYSSLVTVLNLRAVL